MSLSRDIHSTELPLLPARIVDAPKALYVRAFLNSPRAVSHRAFVRAVAVASFDDADVSLLWQEWLMQNTTQTTPRLLLTPREAAQTLAISPRKLWEVTKTGGLPCVRIGRAVRYDITDLQSWITAQKEVSL